jgi:cyclopropane fatty-acyl-phospholipid synthase-like methyltransferase
MSRRLLRPNAIARRSSGWAEPMTLSPRLADVLDRLPLKPDMRVLEIGCGPGALARAMADRVGDGFVLGIDRSEKAVALAEAASLDLIERGRLAFRKAAIEEFALAAGEKPFDLIVAVRVGAFDGRHPAAGVRAMKAIREVRAQHGRLFVDGLETTLD